MIAHHYPILQTKHFGLHTQIHDIKRQKATNDYIS